LFGHDSVCKVCECLLSSVDETPSAVDFQKSRTLRAVEQPNEGDTRTDSQEIA